MNIYRHYNSMEMVIQKKTINKNRRVKTAMFQAQLPQNI